MAEKFPLILHSDSITSLPFHFPIHGIRIYSGEELLHEGTFCWVCGNFSFSYPQGSAWLDSNAELKATFMIDYYRFRSRS